jgi:1-acyl-sn-glycerol-3-phosphate acyltransferase
MYYFYLLLFFYAFISSFYLYKKNFNNFDKLISFVFKQILKYLSYEIESYDETLLPSKLIIISSHTSIYDFIIGTFVYYAYLHEKYDTYVLMKKEFEKICSPLLVFFDKKFKLISVNSTKKIENHVSLGLTDTICNSLKEKNNYILYIAPEGTRKCTDKLRSGYWNISKILNVDVMYLGINFSSKKIFLEKPREVEDSWDDEKIIFINSCKKYIPMYPERCYWTKDFYYE